MNEDTLNMSMRKFLKRVGVTSQREIETAIHEALAQKKLMGNEKLKVKVTLAIEDIDLIHSVEDTIDLQ